MAPGKKLRPSERECERLRDSYKDKRAIFLETGDLDDERDFQEKMKEYEELCGEEETKQIPIMQSRPRRGFAVTAEEAPYLEVPTLSVKPPALKRESGMLSLPKFGGGKRKACKSRRRGAHKSRRGGTRKAHNKVLRKSYRRRGRKSSHRGRTTRRRR